MLDFLGQTVEEIIFMPDKTIVFANDELYEIANETIDEKPMTHEIFIEMFSLATTEYNAHLN